MTVVTFPVLLGLKYDSLKTPVWSTRVLTTANGKESRAANWSYPRWKFKLAFEFLRDNVSSEIQTLMGFCNARQGQFDKFYYSDPSDNAYVAQTIGTGDGVTVAFPLIRTYGGFSEPVLHAPTVSAVYLNGVSQATPSVWTATASTGGYGTDTITFASPPANGVAITADFIMNYVCRFTQDEFEFNYMMEHFWECQSIEFESIK